MALVSPVMKITINRKWWIVIAILACLSILGIHQHRGKLYRHPYDVEKARLAELPAISPWAEADTVIVNVNLVPMTSEAVLPDHSVSVQQGKIIDVRQDLDFDPADGVRIIDGTGGYLTPGLADMHVHMDENVFSHRLFLINGVTSVREMSGSGKILDWKRAVADNEIIGPDIYTTGPILRGNEAWLTATRNAAVAVSAEDKWGTIEPGKQADFILLSKNPFQDINHSTSIIGVMKKGRWFDNEALKKLRTEIKNAVD
ncbi:MAG: amidohydrolase family protein [Gammaproteobacteria bacterium]|nr:amidohydrolase family protein [Gammaproteobacteria bacterium]